MKVIFIKWFHILTAYKADNLSYTYYLLTENGFIINKK